MTGKFATFSASDSESPRTPPFPVMRPVPKSRARPEKARSEPRLDRVSGCRRSIRSLPSDPLSLMRRSSVRLGSNVPSPPREIVKGCPLASPWKAKRPGRGASSVKFAVANSAVPRLADVRARRPFPEGARKISANRAVRPRRPIPMRDDPVPALSRSPFSERSSIWPLRASSPALKTRFPPIGIPATREKRPRSGARPLIEPCIKPVSRAIRRLPSIALSAAVSRKRGSTN